MDNEDRDQSGVRRRPRSPVRQDLGAAFDAHYVAGRLPELAALDGQAQYGAVAWTYVEGGIQVHAHQNAHSLEHLEAVVALFTLTRKGCRISVAGPSLAKRLNRKERRACVARAERKARRVR